MFLNIYKNKKVLVTGHTGFKGSWLILWLKILGADVYGFSLKPFEGHNHYRCVENFVDPVSLYGDISDFQLIKKFIDDIQPDFIFHLAAQAIVSESFANPLFTFTTNAIGTANILEALKCLNKKVILISVTSDKVYKNREWSWGYREIDELGGDDPYSASKSMAELVLSSYHKSFFSNSTDVRVGIVRAGNVIGGGDWARGRIVPDCIRAWSKSQKITLKNPSSVRPWQHVLEPLSGYLHLGANLFASNELTFQSYNFGPDHNECITVENLIKKMSDYWVGGQYEISNTPQSIKESGLLKLNCDKVIKDIGWKPILNIDVTTNLTINWYKNYYLKNADFILSMNQINNYIEIAKNTDAIWTK